MSCGRRLTLLGALVSIFLTGCELQPDIAVSTTPVAGNVSPVPAPAFAGTGVNGEPVDLASLRGHVVVIDFWGSWCGPCRQEQPALTKLATTYQARGVDFLGDDMRDNSDAARGYVTTFRVPYPSLPDPSLVLAATFNVVAPPTILVIDREGIVRGEFLATLTGLPELIDRLNAKP